MARAGESRMVRVWDVPTRIVHWAMAVLIPFSWWTAEHDQMDRHRLSGYVLLGLLIFRLIWGVAGGTTARFADFVRGPRGVLRYLREGGTPAPLGHNPLGGWSVVAMLLVLAGQIGLGLFAVDEDGIESGPLSYLVDFDTGRALAGIHHKLFWVLVALIALHILAILFYLVVRRRNLVTAMISGRARAEAADGALRPAPLWRFAVAALVAAALAWFVASGLRL